LNDIQQNIQTIKNKIREWETRYQRIPGSVSLLAVSKKQPLEKIREAIRAGQRAFGENYLQESLEKISELANENIEWHFIGPIQRNKTKKIAEHFAWVHTVSEVNVAKRLSEQRPSHLPPLNICLQVNTSFEITKSGIDPEQVLSLAEYCKTLPQLTLRGLMTIPAHKNSFAEQCAELHKLRVIYDELNERGFKLDTLSMGMSDDMEAAIAEGATLLRIGTAIFGERIV
jgi:pyridoxal phosphate enzyme (YggS family)